MRDRLGIVGAIVRKDLRLFARDRFYAIMTAAGLVFYVAIFWVLPSTVDETFSLGVTGGDVGPFLEAAGEVQEGTELLLFDSDAQLRAAVVGEGERPVVAGIAFPDRFIERTRAGERTSVQVYLSGDIPDELRGAVSSFVRELAFVLSGEQIPVTIPDQDELVLGPDRSGDQVSLRERMRPMLVFAALLVEMLALATLVASEISARTATAVLVTPARASDLLAAKFVVGTGLAFGEAFLIAAATGSLATQPVLILVALLLGAVLVTGLGLVAGSTGRDFIGIVFWSMLFFIPLLVPAIAQLFPGTSAGWIRALPSYGLIDVIVGVTAYGDGWSDALPQLGALLGWCVIAFAVGVVALRRKVATL